MNAMPHRHVLPVSKPPLVALSLLALASGCGGDDGGQMMMPLPAQATISFQAVDPCGADTPRPTDLFFDETGRADLDDCPLPMDPLDAVVELVLRDQRAELDPRITLPVDGSLDLGTLSSTVSLGFGSGGSAEGLPPVALIELTGTASVGSSWRSVDVSASFEAGAITLLPSRALLPNRFHVVLATAALKDTGSPVQSLAPSSAVRALVGDTPISAGTFEGLDAAGAERLERMRQALAPAIVALASANPPVTTADIVSIHGFTTRAGDTLAEEIVRDYEASVQAGVYPYTIEIEGRDIPPADIYGRNVPAAVYPNVGSFIRGVVKAPRVVGDDLRLRPRWTEEAQTVDVPFLLSIPRQGETYPVAVHVVGFGRSRIDARALANVMGGAPRGSALAIELRCHGRRSPGLNGTCEENRTAAEEGMLIDQESNNGNPEFSGMDGIPDSSGVGFFPGDPRQLRDTQVAAMIEIMHVVGSLRDASAWMEENVPIDRSSVHLVAQGYTALPAAAAAAYADNRLRPRTVQFPAGGADLAELILRGATEQRAAFDATLPGTIGAAQAETLLVRLADYLAPVQIESFGAAVNERFTVRGQLQGLLLPYPSPGAQGTTQYVNQEARNALRNGLSLPSRFVSQHSARCDNYFVFTCRLGNPPSLLEQARSQVAGFIDSNGVTVPDPG